MAEQQQTTNWTELVRGIVRTLTGHHAEITYEFDDMEVHVPGAASSRNPQVPWKINGTLRIRTRDVEPSRDQNQDQVA